MSLRNKAQLKNTTEKETPEGSLLGVDCKRMPNKDTKFHNRRQFQSYQEEETKFAKSVVNNKKLLQSLTKFQPKGLLQKEINCTEDKISVRFTSPLESIFEQRDKCDDLIQEIHSDDGTGSKGRPHVFAANLRWKNGITVRQTTGKNYRNVTREANPTVSSTFDFGSKTKFEKNVLKTICSEFFSEEDVVVLNGNNCHGEIVVGNTKNSQKGNNQETELVYQSSTPYYHERDEDQVTTVGEYIDDEEHKFLLVPYTSKNGLDTDTDKRYIFPYTAKFMVTAGKEKVKYEHSFRLQLALSQTPQHYGLVFTFPFKNNEVHLVKSLISVYSIFPESAQQCSITTYALADKSEAFKSKTSPKSLIANFSYFVEANLREEKLVKHFLRRQFSISCDLAKSQNTNRRQSKLDHLEMKHKNKQEILKHVKAAVTGVH